MNKKKKILIVNWGTPSAFYPLSQTVSLPNYDVYLAATQTLPDQIQPLFSKDKHIVTNPYDTDLLINDVLNFCRKENVTFDAVTTFFEMNVLQAAKLAEKLECRYSMPSITASRTSVNKLKMRNYLADRDIIQPKYATFTPTSLDQAYAFLKKIAGPTIIKPIHSGHSYGARYCHPLITPGEFNFQVQSALNDLKHQYDEWMKYIPEIDNLEFLIEEYVPGTMISINGIIGDSGHIVWLQNCEFEMSKTPTLQQIGHTIPISSLSPYEVKQCKEYVSTIVNGLELHHCAFHCELKFFNHQPFLIEIGARLPGGILLESLQQTSPTDIVATYINYITGVYLTKENQKTPMKAELLTNVYCHAPRVLLSPYRSLPENQKDLIVSIDHINPAWKVTRNINNNGIWLYKLRLKSMSKSIHQLIRMRNKITQQIRIGYVPLPI